MPGRAARRRSKTDRGEAPDRHASAPHGPGVRHADAHFGPAQWQDHEGNTRTRRTARARVGDAPDGERADDRDRADERARGSGARLPQTSHDRGGGTTPRAAAFDVRIPTRFDPLALLPGTPASTSNGTVMIDPAPAAALMMPASSPSPLHDFSLPPCSSRDRRCGAAAPRAPSDRRPRSAHATSLTPRRRRQRRGGTPIG